MSYTIERIEPGIYYSVWTGEIGADLYLQASRDRVARVKEYGDDPYVFILEMHETYFRDWDARVAQRGAEIEPMPLTYIVVSNHMFVQMTINLLRLFMRVERQPTLPAALDQARKLLQTHTPQQT